ncbi:MAG: AMP-binding protein, partial [Actinobacteria bacterium]|nr:AMP-binding protein [Actinomycetota bacterium]
MRSYELPSLVESSANESITDLLLQRVKQTPNLPLFAVEKTPGVWTEVSAKDFLTQVEDLAKGFIASGIRPGDAVGIMSRTRYEWALV